MYASILSALFLLVSVLCALDEHRILRAKLAADRA